jgi:hypothetical protein
VRASFTGTQFVVYNDCDDDWTDVTVDLNGGVFTDGYLCHENVAHIAAGDHVTVGVMQFANNEGVRFNPLQMKPQKLQVSAKVTGAFAVRSVRWR